LFRNDLVLMKISMPILKSISYAGKTGGCRPSPLSLLNASITLLFG
jgi:hypothetical protein